MKKMICMLVCGAIFILMPLCTWAKNVVVDNAKYVGLYFLPQSSTMSHFGDELQIYEITDSYVNFDYQSRHSGRATVFAADIAYFDGTTTAVGNGTVAYSDTPNQTTKVLYKIVFGSKFINLRIYIADVLWRDLTFNLLNQNSFHSSSQETNSEVFSCTVGNKYIEVLDKNLTVTDVDLKNTVEISNNASWNFITDGYYLYYIENDSWLHKVNLSSYKNDNLGWAKNLFIRDCKDNKFVLFEYVSDDAEDLTESSLAVYDIENFRTYYIEDWVLGLGFLMDRVIYFEQTGQYSPVKLYSSDIYGNDKKIINQFALCGDMYVDDRYVYYAEALENTVMSPPFIVKRCDKDGNNITILTDIIKDKYVYNITSEYIECDNSNYSSKERIYFKHNTADTQSISVRLNGTELTFDQPPIMDPQGRVLVPIRKIAEAMGDEVKWNQDLQTAFVNHTDRALIIPLYQNNLYIAHGSGNAHRPYLWGKYSLDVPSQIQNGRTLTPVRAFCESLDATVEWHEDSRTVEIRYDFNPRYDALTADEINSVNMAYTIMSNNERVSFQKYTDEIYAFLDSRSTALDSFAMAWGNGIFDGFVQLFSGEDATKTAIKASLGQIIVEYLSSEESDMTEIIDGFSLTKAGLETANTLMTLPEENLIINSIDDIDKLSDSVPELKALSKKVGAVEALAWSAEEVFYLLTDYAQNVAVLDDIEKYFRETSSGDDLIYEAIDEMRDEYTDKWIHSLKSLRDKGVESILSELADVSTVGVFGMVNFAKDLTNQLTGLSTTADGLYEFYAVCRINGAFDLAYKRTMSNIVDRYFDYEAMKSLFKLQKAAKITAYSSMNKIANAVEQISWDNRINEIQNMTYIIWD